MKLRLVPFSENYRSQLLELLAQWEASAEPVFFERDISSILAGQMPEDNTIFFALAGNRFVGAVTIRQTLPDLPGILIGHVHFAVLPTCRKQGFGMQILALALNLCRRMEMKHITLVCTAENLAAAKIIYRNGGMLQEETLVGAAMEQCYTIDLESSWRFFQNTGCACFPCHKTEDPENFNCMFCFCPLYALGERCGGGFTYTENGIKDCTACLHPHRPENYDTILSHMQDILEMAKKPASTEVSP